MRKSTLVLLTSLLAVAGTAPVANAETATFSGTCAITGVSTFDPPLTSTHQTIDYSFQSGPPADGVMDGTACSGVLDGEPVTDMPVKATVAGVGNLACSGGESTTPGKGRIAFPDGSTFLFDFTFTAVLTEVDFVARFGSVETTGHASFADYAPSTAASDCGGAGLEELGFEASTDPYSGSVEGTRADRAGSAPGTEDRSTAPTPRERLRACLDKAKNLKSGERRRSAKRRCRREACVRKAKQMKNRAERRKAKARCRRIR